MSAPHTKANRGDSGAIVVVGVSSPSSLHAEEDGTPDISIVSNYLFPPNCRMETIAQCVITYNGHLESHGHHDKGNFIELILVIMFWQYL